LQVVEQLESDKVLVGTAPVGQVGEEDVLLAFPRDAATDWVAGEVDS
jgi:hypothetical protein